MGPNTYPIYVLKLLCPYFVMPLKMFTTQYNYPAKIWPATNYFSSAVAAAMKINGFILFYSHVFHAALERSNYYYYYIEYRKGQNPRFPPW